jgi:hypothetical protein
MSGESILKRIIQEEGSCCWANPSVCATCPIGQMRKKSNGSNMSCIDALNVGELTEEEADKRYKEVAERLLLDETIDAILGGDFGTN